MWEVRYTYKAIGDEIIKGEFEVEYLANLLVQLQVVANYQDFLEIHITRKRG